MAATKTYDYYEGRAKTFTWDTWSITPSDCRYTYEINYDASVPAAVKGAFSFDNAKREIKLANYLAFNYDALDTAKSRPANGHKFEITAKFRGAVVKDAKAIVYVKFLPDPCELANIAPVSTTPIAEKEYKVPVREASTLDLTINLGTAGCTPKKYKFTYVPVAGEQEKTNWGGVLYLPTKDVNTGKWSILKTTPLA